MEMFLAVARDRIIEHGFIVQSVLAPPRLGPRARGARRELPFSYTVGLTDAGLPELWLSGLGPQQATGILNDAAKAACAADDGLALGPLKLEWSAVFKVAGPCALEEAEVFLATNLYPHPQVVSVLQVLWPDPAGCYPGDEGYDEARFPQQRLSLRGETL